MDTNDICLATFYQFLLTFFLYKIYSYIEFTMKKILYKKTFSHFFLSLCCYHIIYPTPLLPLELGIDRLFKDGYDKILKGKRIGLLTNQTGIDAHCQQNIKILLDNQKTYQLTALFALEHGLYGEYHAETKIQDKAIPHNGIPIFSLYGENKRPTKQMLSHIDILIIDIQDIGVRYYTFTTSILYVIEEASKSDILVMILDRPNPMGGTLIDGPPLNKNISRSFASYIDVPICHGLTIGELAQFYNEEYKIRCSLIVVPLKGWSREMNFHQTKFIWIPPSPHIPDPDTPYFYATTGLIGELGSINIGVGYTMPFKIVGAPWINGELLAKTLNKQNIPGAVFTPIHYTPFYGSFKGTLCHGVQIHIRDYNKYRPFTVQSFILGTIKAIHRQEFTKILATISSKKKQQFITLYGNTEIYQYLLSQKFITWPLIEHYDKEREHFRKKRIPYLLY